MLELAVLGLLKESAMSGYELRKQLTAKLGAFWRVSFGSLYPCLNRLAADGAIAEEPDPAASRKRRRYGLTPRGDVYFQQLLESADMHDFEQDRFALRLAFFRYLRPETRIDQLERRRGYLQERQGDLRATLRAARDRMDAYTLSLMTHGIEEREREIAWLDGLINTERGVIARPAAARPRRTRRVSSARDGQADARSDAGPVRAEGAGAGRRKPGGQVSPAGGAPPAAPARRAGPRQTAGLPASEEPRRRTAKATANHQASA